MSHQRCQRACPHCDFSFASELTRLLSLKRAVALVGDIIGCAYHNGFAPGKSFFDNNPPTLRFRNSWWKKKIGRMAVHAERHVAAVVRYREENGQFYTYWTVDQIRQWALSIGVTDQMLGDYCEAKAAK